MKTRIVSVFLFLLIGFGVCAQEEVYELRTYELGFFGPAEVLHNYFEQALIPALNRQGIDNVGAFEESVETMPKKIYLLIGYDNIQSFQDSKDALAKDEKYLQDADSYLNAPEASIPFKRISTSLIRSTTGFPKLVKPNDDANLFELRIYDSYNEDALRRKVKMFNDSEFVIFDEVGLPMVFFGHNIAGNQMPCLTYLLAFKDMNAHGEAWSKFLAHPEWVRILKLEEYANTINEITRVFLKPLPYSQL
ncbi:NIPSNAP family protein [Flagellimonas allohymeniacidonis]|uniref:NIPSNAP family containing protein n=1 Tax=Flagellimonas allohymeniacidonis TaxID=2517819 RepID=A0A4Q8QB76_9FLAO|nr:NIPSNAP family protein [Allomuricauda hymeniacidonis]TAI47585.1 NIPSNAP family containing protein [Allomuricauda hymeniacidonis]